MNVHLKVCHLQCWFTFLLERVRDKEMHRECGIVWLPITRRLLYVLLTLFPLRKVRDSHEVFTEHTAGSMIV